MAKKVNMIIGGALAVVGVYFVYEYFKKSKKKQEPLAPQVDPILDMGRPTSVVRNDNYPLRKGSRGRKVSALQQWLLKIDKKLLPKYGADGDFGGETEAAVLKVLGKKSVDSDADFDRLMLIYNQKSVPSVLQQPKDNIGTLPRYPFAPK